MKRKVSGEKTNKTFMVLSFIGICMVISGHIFTTPVLNIFGNFFTFNSFFMPMFIFISGYFFKDEYLDSFWKFFKKKFLKLMLYYFIWNLIYGIIMSIRRAAVGGPDLPINFYTLFIEPFVDGGQFGINIPSWFIPTLFTVEIAYWFVRKIEVKLVGEKCVPSAVILAIIFAVINMGVVWFAKHVGFSGALLVLGKIGFFMAFYYMGAIYNRYLEKWETKIPSAVIFIVCPLTNAFLMIFFETIEFPNLFILNKFMAPVFYPIITSTTGILFWLRISRLIAPAISKSKIVNMISNNTKDIMMHHLFFITITQLVMFGILKAIGLADDYAPSAIYQGLGDVFYYPHHGALFFSAILFLVGLFAPLGVKHLQEKFINWLKRFFNTNGGLATNPKRRSTRRNGR
ncbi:MAG: acyltransferase family protein [Candidatus Saccharibacteria bacterium]|nr:acyltransferase family protein [Candidatus Saccharibacteria bacterium]